MYNFIEKKLRDNKENEYNCRSCGASLNPNAERCEYCKTYVSYTFKKQKPEEIYSL